MRFISIPLVMMFSPYFQTPPKPPAAAPVQICLFQQPTGAVSVGTCPPSTSNLPASVAASTLPQNTLGLLMADGTVIPLSIVNPAPLPTANVARLAAITPLAGNGGGQLVAPIFQTDSELPGVTYVQANIMGWQPNTPATPVAK